MKKHFRFGVLGVAVLFLIACLFLGANSVEAQANYAKVIETIDSNYLPSINNSLGELPDINEGDAPPSITSKVLNGYSNYMYDYRDKHSTDVLPSSYCLRDDYLLYASMQNPNGLCWAYASAEALATTIMMGTKEYIDPSEAWVSLICALAGQDGAYSLDGYLAGFDSLADSLGLTSLSDNDIKTQINSLFLTHLAGDGGNFIYFDMVLRAFGLVYETDFDYSMFNFAGKTKDGLGNLDDYYNYYSRFAVKEIVNDVKAIKFEADKKTLNNLSSSERQNLFNSVKYHIKNRGSIYCALDWKDCSKVTVSDSKKITAVNYLGTPSGGHAVSIIGWDDDIEIVGDDDNTHKGAWIALNSWGDYWGDDGIFYIFYDCTDYNDCFRGYVYEKDKSDTLYLKISTDSSQAESGYVTTDKKGAYYDSFASSKNATQQRNLIYSNDIDITYNYNLAADATIDSISILKGTEDHTASFTRDSINNKIRITGNNVGRGTYKLVIKYHLDDDLDNVYENINCFSLLDKNETGFAYAEIIDKSSNNTINDANKVVANMGRYFLYNNYISGNNEIIIPIKSTFSDLQIKITYYSSSYGNKFIAGYDGVYFIYEDGTDNNNTDKYFEHDDRGKIITTYKSNTLGTGRTYELIFYPLQDNDSLVDIVYDTNGGINNENNKSRMVYKTDDLARIYEPTRDGCIFSGWYLDSDFTKPLTKDNQGYYVFNENSFKSLNVINSNTSDTKSADYNYYKESNTAFLYAKWEKDENRAEVSFYIDGQEDVVLQQRVIKDGVVTKPNNPTKTGYEFKYWSTGNGQEYDFSTPVTQDLELYAVFELNAPSDVSIYLGGSQYSNSTLVSLVEYTFEARFNHEIKDSLIVYYSWEVNELTVGTSSSFNRRFTPGTYTLKLAIKVGDGSQNIESSVTREITVTNFPTNSVTISRRGISTTISVSGVRYDVKIYKLEDGYSKTNDASITGYDLVAEISELNNLNVDFSNYTEESGSYKLLVDKYTNLYRVENAVIETFDVVTLHYNGIYSGVDKTVYLDKGTTVAPLDSASVNAFVPVMAGHDLLAWCSDVELKNIVSSMTIDADMTLYAKWGISAFVTSASSGGQLFKTVNYNPNSSVGVVAQATYSGDDITCSYKWYKIGDSKVKSTKNRINIANCVDSGRYYCIITLKDSLGLTKTSSTNAVEISIIPQSITIKAKDVTATWLFGEKELEYEIVSEFDGDEEDLNIKLTTDADVTKTGSYAIHVSIDNTNYELTEIAGVYEVRATTFIFAGVAIGVVGLAVILVVRKIKHRY